MVPSRPRHRQTGQDSKGAMAFKSSDGTIESVGRTKLACIAVGDLLLVLATFKDLLYITASKTLPT